MTLDPIAGPVHFQGSAQINQLTSVIGRAGLRVGTSVEAGNLSLQPFAAVSVWHEFEGNISASYSSCPRCILQPIPGQLIPSQLTAAITSGNIGTYGQYSVGVSGQLIGTGWLGFARVDYRNGSHLEGVSGTGGIRYQFTPDVPESASMPAKAAVLKAPPQGAYNWTGLYLGGFGGAAYGHSDMGFPPLGSAGPQNSGALAGGQVGYNFQTGSWVFGIEGDAAWANIAGSAACTSLDVFAAPLFQTSCHDQADFIATATGRLGYATGRTLYYAKAGAAWAHESFSVTCNFGVTVLDTCTNPAGHRFDQFSVSDTRLGWTIGYGIEFALARNWSAKGEVDYADFGKKNLTASDGTVINAGMRVIQAKVGLNYKLQP